MPFSAGRLGALLRGFLLIGLLAPVASCTKTTVAGVMLHFVGDPTLNPDTLDVTITANGQAPLDRVLELDILFSGKCSAQVGSVVGAPHGTNCPYGVAESRCPTGETTPMTATAVSAFAAPASLEGKSGPEQETRSCPSEPPRTSWIGTMRH